LGNRGPAFRYSDFDIRLPGLAREKYVTLRQERHVGCKSKRGVRQLPDAVFAVIRVYHEGGNVIATHERAGEFKASCERLNLHRRFPEHRFTRVRAARKKTTQRIAT
jgi:hypothetical protein